MRRIFVNITIVKIFVNRPGFSLIADWHDWNAGMDGVPRAEFTSPLLSVCRRRVDASGGHRAAAEQILPGADAIIDPGPLHLDRNDREARVQSSDRTCSSWQP